MTRVLVLSLFFTLCHASAQTQELKWSDKMEMPSRNRSVLEHILGEYNDHFYTFRVDYKTFGANELYLECYDIQSLSKAWDKKLSIPVDSFPDAEVKFEDLHMLGNKIYLFYEVRGKKPTSLRSFGRVYDTQGEVIIEDREVDVISSASSDQGAFDYIIASDSNSILIFHSKPFRTYNNEQFHYTVIDTSLNRLWEKSITLPYKNRLFDIAEYQMDEEGNIFMLSLFYPDKRTMADIPEGALKNNRYKVIGYFRKENKLKEFEVSLGNKWASSITLGFNAKGDLAIGGFYSKTGDFSIAGTFYLLIDKESKKTVATHLKPFDKSFLMKFMTEKQAEKGEELSSFYFNQLVSLSDGSTVFVAEKFYEIAYTFMDPRTFLVSSTKSLYYNEIILIKVLENGEISWNIKVPKRQYSTNDDGIYSSYGMAVVNDTIKLFFNDHRKNFDNDPDDKIKFMSKPRRARVAMVSVSSDGNVQKEKLCSTKVDGGYVKPRMSVQTNPLRLLMYARQGRKYQFGRISFE